MPGRLGGFYPQGRGFSSAVSAASAVRFFHPVDARWFSPGFSFPLFVSYRLFLVCIFVIVGLAYSINTVRPPVSTR